MIPIRTGGMPVLPDPSGDERLFKTRVVLALKSLVKRNEELQRALSALSQQGGAVKNIESVQNIMGGGSGEHIQ